MAGDDSLTVVKVDGIVRVAQYGKYNGTPIIAGKEIVRALCGQPDSMYKLASVLMRTRFATLEERYNVDDIMDRCKNQALWTIFDTSCWDTELGYTIISKLIGQYELKNKSIVLKDERDSVDYLNEDKIEWIYEINMSIDVNADSLLERLKDIRMGVFYKGNEVGDFDLKFDNPAWLDIQMEKIEETVRRAEYQ